MWTKIKRKRAIKRRLAGVFHDPTVQASPARPDKPLSSVDDVTRLTIEVESLKRSREWWIQRNNMNSVRVRQLEAQLREHGVEPR